MHKFLHSLLGHYAPPQIQAGDPNAFDGTNMPAHHGVSLHSLPLNLFFSFLLILICLGLGSNSAQAEEDLLALPDSSSIAPQVETTTATPLAAASPSDNPTTVVSGANTTDTQEQIQALLNSDAGLQLSQELSELIQPQDDDITPADLTNLASQDLSSTSLSVLLSNIERLDTEKNSTDGSVSTDSSSTNTTDANAFGELAPEELLNALRDKLKQRVDEIAADSSLADSDKERAQAAITNAQNLLNEYITLRENERNFAQEQEQAQSLLLNLEDHLAQANQTFTQEPPEITSQDLSVINGLINELSAQLDNVQHELSLATATYNSLQTLPSRNQNQIQQNNDSISSLQKQLDNLSTLGLLPDEQMVLPFEILVRQKQNALLQNEIRSISLLQDVANYKLHIYGLHKDYLEKYLNLAHAHQSELLREQMLTAEQEQKCNAEQQQEQIPQLHNEFQYNQDFNSYIERALNQQGQLQRELQSVNLALTTTEQIERNLQEQLADLSGSVILSRLLNRQQGELPQIEISFNLDELIPNLNLWIYDLRNYREEIFDVQSYVDLMIAKNRDLEPYRETLAQLIRQRRVLYDDLYNVLSDTLTIANDLRNKYSELQIKGQRVHALINDHLFWLTSNQGISLDFFMALMPNLLQQGQDLVHYLYTDFLTSDNLFNYLKIFLPIALLGVIFFHTRRYFKRLNNKLALRLDKDTDSYLLTPFALFNHFFLIIPRVCLITILGSIVIFITLDNFDDQIMLTYYLSLHVICFLYMRHIMEPNSLEQRHFAISPERLANSRIIIDQIWYISIPMLTIANMRELEPTKIPTDSIGYLLMLLGFLYLTIFACIQVKRMLTNETPTMSKLAVALAGILTPLTITLMLALGYYYTVIQLLNRVAITLYLGFLYIILSQTLRRELHVAEIKLTNFTRRQAMQQEFTSFSNANTVTPTQLALANKSSQNAKKKKLFGNRRTVANNLKGSTLSLGFTSKLFSSTLQDSESSSARKSSNTLPRRSDTPRITATRLELISNRIFKLFNTFLLFFFLYFMYLQWNDLAGVLDYLNQIYLWQSTEVVDGKTIESTLTLKDVLLAVIIIIVAILLNRNLPLLIERVVLLRSNNNTKSISYTLKLISSYVITALGIILAAGALGISWDKLQWLVAALSVGLGFGLQEIFANFVSGIIILFERQIRVGDIVTLNGLSGTVSKIRIRATTIVSFENMEVVIPNKQFITSALTNWSLSNTVTKIVFTIGIAYDADINKAKDLLRGILRRCRDINREKQPAVYVKSLDASAITIMCEVYVNEIGKRKAVFDFLSIESLRIFKENNIEVPFDQMDVTIRNLDTEQVLKFIAAQHGMRPEAIEEAFEAVHRQEQEAKAAEEEEAKAKAAGKEPAKKEDKDDKDEDESVGSRLMRFIGIKND